MSYKVGDVVGFKYDIEQSGPIEKITNDWHGKTYYVRAHSGEYVDNRIEGVLVPMRESDLWTD